MKLLGSSIFAYAVNFGVLNPTNTKFLSERSRSTRMLDQLFRGAWFWEEEEMPRDGSEVNSSHARRRWLAGWLASRLVITVKAADKQENDGMIPLPLFLA